MSRRRPPPASIELQDLSEDETARSQRQHSNRDDQPNPAAAPPNYQDRELKYGAAHVIRLVVPVSLCMALVIATISTIGFYTEKDNVYMLYTPFTKPTTDAAELLAMSIGNAFVVLAVVIVMTALLIFLYYFRFYKVIHAWLLLSSVMLLSFFSTMYIQEVFKAFNIAVDYISIAFFIWNFAALGIICIHWKGPLILQQMYLIIVSALMALVLIKYLPDWTVWTVLGVLSIWDLIAVLCPMGPLRILVETAQKRNEPIFPALIYSSAIIYPYVIFGMTDIEESTEQPPIREPLIEASATSVSDPTGLHRHPNHDAPVDRSTPGGMRYGPVLRRESQRQSQPEAEPLVPPPAPTNGPQVRQPSPSRRQQLVEVVDEGIRLGLGDFIFYSVLVGKASTLGDWNITVACFVSVLIGLAFTLMLLAVFRKALPALPISIMTGMLFYFASREFITPFMNELIDRQIVP
uniref:Presenilin n=1 Tax=Panagrellus redivivus TaxID=6233 RepID=A0A7E4VLT4_PANRE